MIKTIDIKNFKGFEHLSISDLSRIVLIGVQLARLEAKLALECLLERFSEIERDQSITLQQAVLSLALG